MLRAIREAFLSFFLCAVQIPRLFVAVFFDLQRTLLNDIILMVINFMVFTNLKLSTVLNYLNCNFYKIYEYLLFTFNCSSVNCLIRCMPIVRVT